MAPATTPAAAQLSLRERKKIKTRQAIRQAAYRLFEEQGYDATTVEQIAAAAEVSPSTFFRYFPTKEDVVLTDEYDPLMETALLDRPADEPIVESLRHSTIALLRQMFAEGGRDREEILHRIRLSREVPAIRARMSENISDTCQTMATALAKQRGRDPKDLEIRVMVGAVVGAWQEALMHWIDSGSQEDLPSLLDTTLTILAEGFAQPGR
ncbi:TetR family transcriptional regulator [Streptantibioticus rubrisoli]|uniref:TetR family transcriptional regulator n=1 Tax=Streptantibioticus rubrisoli TaxID=1387313 RepID=A0ABT1PGR5_9ACTN|nr:TetR family transcriptional regulator [Streptantibioticus rubrisoli]MCQ4043408.1 TetR family transcriptional regulator [Streptantibioticus rubrisoli]